MNQARPESHLEQFLVQDDDNDQKPKKFIHLTWHQQFVFVVFFGYEHSDKSFGKFNEILKSSQLTQCLRKCIN